MIKAQAVADSLSPQGHRLFSVLVTFPRYILAELNTHRMLSKNSASSRAIPFKKMVQAVQDNPFIPMAWQKDHKGMQGTEYYTWHKDVKWLEERWLEGRDSAINTATVLSNCGTAETVKEPGITKQLCNRLLEPFMWHTVLITGEETGWENFFDLRCPQYFVGTNASGDILAKSKAEAIKLNSNLDSIPNEIDWFKLNRGQADIHMMALAEAIYDSYNESKPKQLKAGEWHILFEDKINLTGILNVGDETTIMNPTLKVKISTAMAARTSYTVVGDEKEFTYEQQIALHDRIISQKPLHASPMEHNARAMDDIEYNNFGKYRLKQDNEEFKGEIGDLVPIRNFEGLVIQERGWCRNFRGFIQYRHLIETGLSV